MNPDTGAAPQPPALPPSRPPSQPRRPPNKPNSPPIDPPSKGVLHDIDATLDTLLVKASLALPASSDPVEICGQEILKFRLRMARRAVADLLAYQTPVRSPLDSAAAVAGGPVSSGRDGKAASAESRPVQHLAGRPPASGGDFLLPRDVRVLT